MKTSRNKLLNIKSYSWSLTLYETPEVIHQFILDNLHIIKYYAYIEHDKDFNTDGSLKDRHVHLLLVFTYNIQLGCLINKMGFKSNVFGEAIKDKKACFEYLTHKNNSDKYHYNDSDVVTNNKEYFLENTKRFRENENLKYLELIEDLINGYTYRDMIVKYGRDYIIHYKQYQEMAYLVLNEKKVIIDNDNGQGLYSFGIED